MDKLFELLKSFFSSFFEVEKTTTKINKKNKLKNKTIIASNGDIVSTNINGKNINTINSKEEIKMEIPLYESVNVKVKTKLDVYHFKADSIETIKERVVFKEKDGIKYKFWLDDIISIDIEGDIRAMSTSNITINITGKVDKVSTSTGTINITSSNMSYSSINSSSGNITVNGDINSATTVNGNIKGNRISNAKSVNGSIST